MAEPIIDSVTVTPFPAKPGDVVTVKINAHDPDEETFTGSGNVTDSGGAAKPFTVLIKVSDPLTYALSVAGLAFTADGIDPSKFTAQIPA